MIRSLYIPAKAPAQYDLTESQMKEALCQPDDLLWVSLENPDDTQIHILHDVFNFHPLAIEDSQSVGYQPPKVDDFGSYIFLIIHAIHADSELVELDTHELNLFLGGNFLVTVFKGDQIEPVEKIFRKIKRDERITQNGSDFLCHAVLDAVVDDYMPIIDKMDQEIETLEDQVLAKPDPEIMQRVINLKHSIMSLRRIISPMREVINRLSRDDFPMIDRQSKIYFRDIYDHLVRIQDMSDTIRDIVSGTMDIYLNSTSLRLNEIMKALTIVSTIFLPLGFLAGVYGMNFAKNYPGYDWDPAIFVFWGMCAAVAGGMLYLFKRTGLF